MKKNLKKIRKLIGIGLLSLLLILIVAILIIQIFFGRIASYAVENMVPKLTGTSTSLGDAGFNLFFGEFYLKDLVLGNPEGYQTDSSFKLGDLRIKVNVKSLFSDTIVVEEVIVDRMQITYEVGMPSNIGKIKENIEKSSKNEKTREKEKKDAKKIYIKGIKIINSEVRASVKGFGGSALPVPLPSIVIKDLGKREQGITFAESLDVFVSEVLNSVQSVVSDVGDLLKEGTKGVIEGAKDAVDKVKNIFK